MPNITEVRLTTPAPAATPPTGPVQVVSVNFVVPIPHEFAVTINELKQGTPLGPPWGPESSPGPGPTRTTTTLTIAGHPITLTTWPITTPMPIMGPSTAYVWTAQGTTFQLTALLVPPTPVKQQDVEHMIASMLP